MIHAQLGHLR